MLHNISLKAHVGQITALVGASGCGKNSFFRYSSFCIRNLFEGKSTCISLLLRYYEPSSGRITVNGRPVTDHNIEQLRRNIGVVSQEPVCSIFGFDLSILPTILII